MHTIDVTSEDGSIPWCMMLPHSSGSAAGLHDEVLQRGLVRSVVPKLHSWVPLRSSSRTLTHPPVPRPVRGTGATSLGIPVDNKTVMGRGEEVKWR